MRSAGRRTSANRSTYDQDKGSDDEKSSPAKRARNSAPKQKVNSHQDLIDMIERLLKTDLLYKNTIPQFDLFMGAFDKGKESKDIKKIVELTFIAIIDKESHWRWKHRIWTVGNIKFRSLLTIWKNLVHLHSTSNLKLTSSIDVKSILEQVEKDLQDEDIRNELRQLL